MASRKNKRLNKGDAKRYGIDTKQLFPRSKIAKGGELTPYQRRRLRQAIIHKSENERIVLAPDRPDYYQQAGFLVIDELVYPASERIKINKLYFAEGACEFYSASFVGAVMNVQMIPSVSLPAFLEAQILIDEEEGQFYDKITLREADANVWGGEQGFMNMHDSAEDLLFSLQTYLRRGALSGGGGTFDYIQVCYINLQF